MKTWYNKSIDEIVKEIDTNIESGLTKKEVNSSMQKYGYNKLNQKRRKTLVERVLNQFKDFMIIILIISAGLSSVLGYLNNEGIIDGVIILLVVFVNAIIGVVQENKANDSLEALKKMTANTVKVIRDNEVIEIDSKNLVIGDIVYIETGDFIPADIRLIDATNLYVNESSLTGESTSIEKNTNIIKNKVSIGDTKNMVFSGTFVTNGRGEGIVVNIGMKTKLGEIASMINQVPEVITPLKKRLEQLGKVLGIAAIIICSVMFIIGMFYNGEIMHLIMTSVAIAVAVIPEGLPAVFTIVLAVGVNKMAKKNAIIKNLSSVETLGSTTIICSDKTGTLTQNKMVIEKVFFDNKLYENKIDMATTLEKLITISVLCNDSMISHDGVIGDPTETSFINFARKLNIDTISLNDKMKRIKEIPFDSTRKLMTTVNKFDNKYIVCVKGAVDEILKISNEILIKDNIKNIGKYKNIIIKTNEQLANEALRVLGCAYKILDKIPDDNEMKSLENNLIYVGMVGMIDPPRECVKTSILNCKNAGITPIMITGDHKITAASIAMKLGIADNMSQVIEGAELDLLSDEEFDNKIYDYKVYARVAPSHKVRIVQCFQTHGEVVAMSGDGVNDAPALKNADIGVAMGITGTDVSKEASDIILTDDNFSSIVDAVFEGRQTYRNIVKSIEYLLSSNLAEVFVLFLATLFTPIIASVCGITDLAHLVPLLPIHILWINLVTDSLPALALSVDPASKELMDPKVLKNNKVLFNKSRMYRIIYQGIMVGILTLIGFIIGLNTPNIDDVTKIMTGQTMAFLVLSFTQLTHIFNVREEAKSIFTSNPFNNSKLIFSILFSIFLMSIIYLVPFLRNIFGIAILSLNNFFVIIILALLPIVIVEILKIFRLNGND
ncbi:MAG: cation-translocating P-type ATPase [Bacilli bacterium]